MPLGRSLPTASLARMVASPGWGGLVVLVASLLSASLLSPVWFARAAEDAAVAAGRAAAEVEEFGRGSPHLRIQWQGVVPADARAGFFAAMDALPGFGEPVVTGRATGPERRRTPLVTANGRSLAGTLWTRTRAVERLGPPSPSSGDRGVWLPDQLARRLGVVPGDSVRLSLTDVQARGLGPRVVRVGVAGTYRAAPRSSVPTALVGDGVDPLDYPWSPEPGRKVGAALVIAEERVFQRLVTRLQDEPAYTADMRLADGVDPPALERAVLGAEALGDRFYDPRELLRNQLLDAEPRAVTPVLVTGARQLWEGARTAARQAEVQVRPFVRATQVLCFGLVLVSLRLLAERRVLEHGALTSAGVSPGTRAVLACAELLPVVVAAAPLGVVLGMVNVRVFGPPGRVPWDEVLGESLGRLTAGALVVLLGGAAVAVWTGWRHERVAARPAPVATGTVRLGVGEVAVLATAVVVGAAVVGSEVQTRATGPLTVLLPVTVTLAVAVASSTVWRTIRPRLARSRGTPGSARWLARSRRTTTVLVPVVLTMTVGLGVLGYSLAVRRGVVDGVADKAAAMAGAETTVELGQALQGREWSEAARVGGPRSTVVYGRGAALPPNFGERPLLVVDPGAFARAVDWGRTLSREGRRALRALETTDVDDAAPVVVVGDADLAVGDTGALTFQLNDPVPIVVRAVVAAFPGTARTSGFTVLTSREGLQPFLSAQTDPGVPAADTVDLPTSPFSATVWSARSVQDVRRDLAEAGLSGTRTTTLAEARARPELLASVWAVGYLGPLQVGSLVLVLAASALLARRLLDRDATTDVMLRHMGWSWVELLSTRSRELLSVLVLAVLAAALAVCLLVLAPTSVDGVPDIPPQTRPRLSWEDGAWWSGAVVATLLVGHLALILGRRARPAGEVLRDVR